MEGWSIRPWTCEENWLSKKVEVVHRRAGTNLSHAFFNILSWPPPVPTVPSPPAEGSGGYARVEHSTPETESRRWHRHIPRLVPFLGVANQQVLGCDPGGRAQRANTSPLGYPHVVSLLFDSGVPVFRPHG